MRCREGEPVEQVDRAFGVLGADPEVEGGQPLRGAVEAEHLVDDAELEHRHLVGEEDGDGTQGHDRAVWHIWQEIVEQRQVCH